MDAGNVSIDPQRSGLRRESVVNVSQLYTLDQSLLLEHVGTLSPAERGRVDRGLRIVLSL